jgi:NAD(P)H-dependent FMN reductase
MPSDEVREYVRVLAICGSLKKAGTSRKALRVALAGAKEAGATVSLADLAFYDLAFCTGNKSPESKGRDFERLRGEIRAAHGLIVATPEYHGSFSGILKNALDLHDIDDVQGKVVGLVATAGAKQGGGGALIGLRAVFRALKAWILPQDVSVPESGKAFAEDGSLLDPALQFRLHELGRQVARFAALHSGTSPLPEEARGIPENHEPARMAPAG